MFDFLKNIFGLDGDDSTQYTYYEPELKYYTRDVLRINLYARIPARSIQQLRWVASDKREA